MKHKMLRGLFKLMNTNSFQDLLINFKYDRKLALDFKTNAKLHDERFLTNSTFGQLFRQLKDTDSEFTMFASSEATVFSCKINELVEQDSFDENKPSQWQVIREIEQDLCSNRLPLLVRTRNGQLHSGRKRDCWILNPNVTEPN